MRSHVRFAPRPLALASTALGSVLAAAVFSAAACVAACGGGGSGGGEPGPGARVPGIGAPSASVAGGAPGSSGAPSTSGSAAASPAGTGAAPIGPMKPIAASAFAEDLRKLGIDPLKPPPLNKLSPDTLRKVMPTFAKSLGVKCSACHDTDDFKAWTPKKRVASKMWQELVVGMAMEDGTPLYCDSCHGGKMEFLDRRDKKALSGWMDANYVKKLKRSDKKESSCEGCHGDPFDAEFLDAWKVAAR